MFGVLGGSFPSIPESSSISTSLIYLPGLKLTISVSLSNAQDVCHIVTLAHKPPLIGRFKSSIGQR